MEKHSTLKTNGSEKRILRFFKPAMSSVHRQKQFLLFTVTALHSKAWAIDEHGVK